MYVMCLPLVSALTPHNWLLVLLNNKDFQRCHSKLCVLRTSVLFVIGLQGIPPPRHKLLLEPAYLIWQTRSSFMGNNQTLGVGSSLTLQDNCFTIMVWNVLLYFSFCFPQVLKLSNFCKPQQHLFWSFWSTKCLHYVGTRIKWPVTYGW